MALITLKEFDNPIDAHLLKSRLINEDIDCYIFDENIVALNPLYNTAIGGIKLRIDERDLDKALIILKEIDDTPNTNEDNEVVICPNCGSSDLISGYKSMKDTKGIIAAFVSFIFMVLPIYYKTVYKCKDCDTEFKG
ncbi:DUF2007 domain-containing protein [Pedobacter glucosidilyticus]|uniref:putative signal transducing protein n=1 Tax=Pedobacter glucosidilyticus TaxID=1122941 RepID=UPI00040A38BF|nr:DUF2007 domain-containing protein [Pedobacter glucosidilyticus]